MADYLKRPRPFRWRALSCNAGCVGIRWKMLSRRRFLLSRSLPLGWLVAWVVGLALWVQTLFPEPLPSRAQAIEWQIHDGGSCLGDVLICPIRPPIPMQFERPGLARPSLLPVQINAARQWRTVTFTGGSIPDFIDLQTVVTHLRALTAGTVHAGGIRIQLSPRVSYSLFFEVLSLVETFGQRTTCWLDTRHTPMTLYFVTFANEASLTVPSARRP